MTSSGHLEPQPSGPGVPGQMTTNNWQFRFKYENFIYTLQTLTFLCTWKTLKSWARNILNHSQRALKVKKTNITQELCQRCPKRLGGVQAFIFTKHLDTRYYLKGHEHHGLLNQVSLLGQKPAPTSALFGQDHTPLEYNLSKPVKESQKKANEEVLEQVLASTFWHWKVI